MSNTFNIKVQIEQINKENNQIIFKPYSSAYKNKIEEYPSKAINISALDPNRDLKEQLLQISVPLIRDVLYTESPELFDKLFKEMPEQQGSVLTKEITPQQLFNPAEIFPVPTPTEHVSPDSTTELISSTSTFEVIA